MNRPLFLRLAVATALLGPLAVGPLTVGPARADEPGQPLLDRAMSAKLDADSPADLAKVVEFCEQALEKGLDADGERFAKELATGSLNEQAEAQIVQAVRKIGEPAGQKLRKEAVELLKKSLDLQPDQFEANLLLARAASLPGRRGDDELPKILERGRVAADAAVRLAGSDAEQVAKALFVRATLAEDDTSRLADLNQAILQDADNPAARLMRAELRKRSGDDAGALEDLRTVLKGDAANGLALRQAVAILLEQEQLDEATGLLETYLADHEGDDDLRQVRAQLLLKQEKHDEALAEIDRVLKKSPDDREALTIRIDILRAMERYGDAVDEFKKAFPGSRMPPPVRALFADLLLDAEQYAEAKKQLDRVLRRQADQPALLFARSRANIGLKDYDAAILDLEAAIDQLGEDPALLIQLAFYYEVAERSERAIEIFGDAIKAIGEPEDDGARKLKAEAIRGRGDARLSIGDHAAAVPDYEKALKLVPDDDGVLNNLAWVLSTSPDDAVRNGKRALELAKKAVEVTESKKPHIISTLASAYAEVGDFEQAREWSAKAVELAKEQADDAEMIEHLEKELTFYQRNEPFRERKTREAKPPLKRPDADGSDDDSGSGFDF